MKCIRCGLPIYKTKIGDTYWHSASYQQICEAVKGTSTPPIHAAKPYSQDINPHTHLNRPT